jgi:hypothetical protein
MKHLISPMVVIVDALDECEDKNGVAKLIDIITGVFRGESSCPLRFFFTSRLEDYIGAKFAEPSTQLKTCRLALEDFKSFAESEDDEIARWNGGGGSLEWLGRAESGQRRWIGMRNKMRPNNLSTKTAKQQQTTSSAYHTALAHVSLYVKESIFRHCFVSYFGVSG